VEALAASSNATSRSSTDRVRRERFVFAVGVVLGAAPPPFAASRKRWRRRYGAASSPCDRRDDDDEQVALVVSGAAATSRLVGALPSSSTRGIAGNACVVDTATATNAA